MRNKRLRFLCRQVHVRIENKDTPFTCTAKPGQVSKMPIAHMEGNYFCDAATLAEIERNKQVIFRYVHPDGRTAGPDDFDANPNGALGGIAGISNREGNVVGLMPHPERAVELPLGSTDGLVIFRSLVESLTRRVADRVSA
jgi:phosphoribosylformylglycinamidine (FGAM) synthase-like amidotransferase family enzyme